MAVHGMQFVNISIRDLGGPMRVSIPYGNADQAAVMAQELGITGKHKTRLAQLCDVINGLAD